jgi:hypothetical protein
LRSVVGNCSWWRLHGRASGEHDWSFSHSCVNCHSWILLFAVESYDSSCKQPSSGTSLGRQSRWFWLAGSGFGHVLPGSNILFDFFYFSHVCLHGPFENYCLCSFLILLLSPVAIRVNIFLLIYRTFGFLAVRLSRLPVSALFPRNARTEVQEKAKHVLSRLCIAALCNTRSGVNLRKSVGIPLGDGGSKHLWNVVCTSETTRQHVPQDFILFAERLKLRQFSCLCLISVSCERLPTALRHLCAVCTWFRCYPSVSTLCVSYPRGLPARFQSVCLSVYLLFLTTQTHRPSCSTFIDPASLWLGRANC